MKVEILSTKVVSYERDQNGNKIPAHSVPTRVKLIYEEGDERPPTNEQRLIFATEQLWEEIHRDGREVLAKRL